MKIVRPYAKMIWPFGLPEKGTFTDFNIFHGKALLSIVEAAARVSHRSESGQTAETCEKFIRSVVMDKGDWSVTEHASVMVEFLVDRGVSHELVRHRLASYTQESTRFVRYFKEKDDQVVNPATFIYPIPEVECELCLAGNPVRMRQKQQDWVHDEELDREGFLIHRPDPIRCDYDPDWLWAIHTAEKQYQALVRPKDKGGKGWRPQEARSVFPNALSTKVVATMNLRTWRHVFMMRTTLQAHPQFRQVSLPLLQEFQIKIPILYDDLEPNHSQAASIARAR